MSFLKVGLFLTGEMGASFFIDDLKGSLLSEQSPPDVVPNYGIVELFPPVFPEDSFFVKWPDPNIVGFFVSLIVFYTFEPIPSPNDLPVLNPFLLERRELSLICMFELFRLELPKSLGTVLAGPPHELDDPFSDSFVMSVCVGPFDTPNDDCEARLTLLRSMPLFELCLLRVSFGFDFAIY